MKTETESWVTFIGPQLVELQVSPAGISIKVICNENDLQEADKEETEY